MLDELKVDGMWVGGAAGSHDSHRVLEFKARYIRVENIFTVRRAREFRGNVRVLRFIAENSDDSFFRERIREYRVG